MIWHVHMASDLLWTMALMQLMKFFMVSCAQDVEIDIAQLALGAGKDGPSEGR